MKRVLLLLGIFCITCSSIYAQDVKNMQDERARIQKEIATLQSRISRTADNIEGRLVKYRMGQQLLDGQKNLIKDIDRQIAATNHRIVLKTQQITKLQQEREQLVEYYRLLLYQAYKHRDKKIWVLYVMASQDIRQAYRRWRYFKEYGVSMRSHVERIKTAESLLQQEQAQLQALQQEQQLTRRERQKQVTQMEESQRVINKDVAALRSDEKQLKARLNQRVKEQRKLEAEIKKALAAAEKKAPVADPAAKEASRTLTAHFAENKGRLPWPIDDAVVLERFGKITDKQWGFTIDNKGVTLSAPRGAAVKSVFNGTVTSVWVDNRDSYLIRVLVNHGDYYTIYCHMVEVSVKEGDVITTGQKLGDLAPAGEVCFFQILKKSTPLNPQEWCTD